MTEILYKQNWFAMYLRSLYKAISSQSINCRPGNHQQVFHYTVHFRLQAWGICVGCFAGAFGLFVSSAFPELCLQQLNCSRESISAEPSTNSFTHKKEFQQKHMAEIVLNGVPISMCCLMKSTLFTFLQAFWFYYDIKTISFSLLKCVVLLFYAKPN